MRIGHFVSKDPEDPKKEVPIDTEAFVQIEEKIKRDTGSKWHEPEIR